MISAARCTFSTLFVWFAEATRGDRTVHGSVDKAPVLTTDQRRRRRIPAATTRTRFCSAVLAVRLVQRRPVQILTAADRQRNRILLARRVLRDSALSKHTHKRLSSLTWPSNWIGRAFSPFKSVRRRGSCRAGGGRSLPSTSTRTKR